MLSFKIFMRYYYVVMIILLGKLLMIISDYDKIACIEGIKTFYFKLDCSKDRKILKLDLDFEGVTGYSTEEFKKTLKNQFTSIIIEEDIEFVLSSLKAHIKSQNYFIQYKIKLKNNCIKEVEERGKLIYEDNKPIYTEGVIIELNTIAKTKQESETTTSNYNSILNNTLEIINDGLWEWDLHTGSFSINKQFLNKSNYQLDTIPTKIEDLTNAIHYTQREYFSKIKNLIINNERNNFNIDIKIQTLYDGWIWLHMKGMVCTTDSQNKPIKVMGSFTDINEIKNYEALLFENYTTMERIIDSIPVPIFYKTKNGNLTGCNIAFANYLDLQKQNIIGKKVSDFFSDDYLLKSAKIDNKLLTKKTTQVIEIEYLHIDGSKRNVFLHKNIFHNALKGKEEILEIINDVTSQKNIKFELDEKSNFLATIIENFPMILWVINKNGILTLFEGKGLNKIDSFPGELVGHSIYNIFADHPTLIKSVNAALKGNHQLDRINYSGITLETYYTPLFSKDKKNDGVIGISIDITDRVKAEEEIRSYIDELHSSNNHYESAAAKLVLVNSELEKSEQTLKKLNADKDRFFSIISHDLKSPFSSLIGLSEIIADNYDEFDTIKKKEISSALQRNVNNIYNLLENLLDWSKIQIGRFIFDPEKIVVTEIVDFVIDLLSSNAEKKNIKLINKINPDHIAFADNNMIQTILRNLVSNSIKFTPNQGVITLKCCKKNDKLLIEVSDTGFGMKKKDQDKLFKIDVTHSTLGSEGEKGTGLGLILCKELVEKNNGKIWVVSNFGKGSSFYFTLPILSQ